MEEKYLWDKSRVLNSRSNNKYLPDIQPKAFILQWKPIKTRKVLIHLSKERSSSNGRLSPLEDWLNWLEVKGSHSLGRHEVAEILDVIFSSVSRVGSWYKWIIFWQEGKKVGMRSQVFAFASVYIIRLMSEFVYPGPLVLTFLQWGLVSSKFGGGELTWEKQRQWLGV